MQASPDSPGRTSAASPADVRPEDIPGDCQPVHDICGRPAIWVLDRWQHAEVADAIVCKLLRGLL